MKIKNVHLLLIILCLSSCIFCQGMTWGFFFTEAPRNLDVSNTLAHFLSRFYKHMKKTHGNVFSPFFINFRNTNLITVY